MSENKKKLFPKVQKKIKGFLTDESGKISKKNALGISVGAMLLAGVGDAIADCEVSVNHSSGLTNGHYSQIPSYSQNPANTSCDIGDSGYVDIACSTPNIGHYSGIVNGHYSGVSPHSGGEAVGHCSHGSHGSHSSHGNQHDVGGWC